MSADFSAERQGELVILKFTDENMIQKQIVFKHEDFISFTTSNWPEPKKTDFAYNVEIKLRNHDSAATKPIYIFVPLNSPEEIDKATKTLITELKQSESNKSE
jgi:hypothetical protein